MFSFLKQISTPEGSPEVYQSEVLRHPASLTVLMGVTERPVPGTPPLRLSFQTTTENNNQSNNTSKHQVSVCHMSDMILIAVHTLLT